MPLDTRCQDRKMRNLAALIDKAFASRTKHMEVVNPGYSIRFSLSYLDSIPHGTDFLDAFTAWGAEETTDGDFVTMTLPEEWKGCRKR